MYRKIQIVGGKTFSINLPKDWINKMKLDKGSLLKIDQLDNGTLLLSPQNVEKIDVPKGYPIITPSSSLSRDITRAYLLGYDEITIVTDNTDGFSNEVFELIKDKTDAYPAAEIMHVSKNIMKIEIIASLDKNQPDKLIRSMFTLIENMISRISNLLNPKKDIGDIKPVDELNRIIRIDKEVNRKYFLLVRQLRGLIQDVNLRDKLKINTIKIMDYRLIAHMLENIGDNFVSVCEHLIDYQNLIQDLLNKNYDSEKETDELFDGLIWIAEKVKIILNKVQDSFIQKDEEKAVSVINEKTAFHADVLGRLSLIELDPNRASITIILHRFYDNFEMLTDICDLI